MPRSVLIVDDSPTIRGFAKLFLRSLKVDVLEAEDGAAALAIVRKDAPAVAIVDVNMPGMDGLSFVREVRKDPKPQTKALPVILLTGDKSESLRQAGRDAGANEFIEKPIKGAELQTVVRRFLGDASA